MLAGTGGNWTGTPIAGGTEREQYGVTGDQLFVARVRVALVREDPQRGGGGA